MESKKEGKRKRKKVKTGSRKGRIKEKKEKNK